MKVLMINGSRREYGCTYTSLSIIGESLKEEGISAQMVLEIFSFSFGKTARILSIKKGG